jgi:4-hydroxybenzoate polyprenyltransferase
VVNAGDRLAQKARALGDVEKVFEKDPGHISDLFRVLRVHQWCKNFLLFAPLLGAHRWKDVSRLSQVLIAFVAFCLCASSVYVLNDLVDLESDRSHPRKCHRAFAAGRIPLSQGFIGATLLLAASFLIALSLSRSFVITFATYYVLTLLYSLRLKQIPILDVLVLASLYGVRVIAGGYAAQVEVTDWLLALSTFLFVSLAFAKRFTELQWARQANRSDLKGRGYRAGDAQLISGMGISSGYLSVLVLALYITHPAVTQLYRRPTTLWLACPVVLYWISRLWLLAHRDALHDDPIIFALKDKQSWLICLILLAITVAASPVR